MMAIYGETPTNTITFLLQRRFCVSLNEEARQMLRTWEDLLAARRAVTSQAQGQASEIGSEQGNSALKRGFAETRDGDDEEMAESGGNEGDSARFQGRQAFTPFIDGP